MEMMKDKLKRFWNRLIGKKPVQKTKIVDMTPDIDFGGVLQIKF